MGWKDESQVSLAVDGGWNRQQPAPGLCFVEVVTAICRPWLPQH